MRVGVFLPLLFFVGVCLSATSPSASSSSSSASSTSSSASSSSASFSSTPSAHSRFATKQKTLTKALRSLIGSPPSLEERERERAKKRAGEGEGEGEEEQESWKEWAVSSTNEAISLGLMVFRAPIVNLLPGGSSTDPFRETPPHWPKNEKYDLDSQPSDDLLNVWDQLTSSYTGFFKSMNLPATLDSMFGEVVVGHVSQNDPQSLQRYQRSQSLLEQDGLFSHPSALAGSSSLPSFSSSSSSPSSKTFQEKAEGFKERIKKVVQEEKKNKRREKRAEAVCGVGVEVWVEEEPEDTDEEEEPTMIQKCVCPVDYMGENCEEFRPFDCRFTLISPTPACELTGYGVRYEGEPVCLLYSLKDKVSLTYEMKCEFENPPENPDFNPFDYDIYTIKTSDNDNGENDSDDEIDTQGTDGVVAETVTFALSEGRKGAFSAFLKVFNFNRFGDLSASQVLHMSLDQIRGNETLKFDLDFSTIDTNRYVFGGRLYAELGLQTVANGGAEEVAGLKKNIRDRRHFDFVDSTLRVASVDYMSSGWKRFLLLYVAIGVSLLLFVVYWANRCMQYLKQVDKED